MRSEHLPNLGPAAFKEGQNLLTRHTHRCPAAKTTPTSLDAEENKVVVERRHVERAMKFWRIHVAVAINGKETLRREHESTFVLVNPQAMWFR